MPRIKTHMRDCEAYLGAGYEEVHKFLDQYAEIFPPVHFFDYHRTFLHNSFGIEIVKLRWGKEGLMAAMIHLTGDYIEAEISYTYKTWEEVEKNFPKVLMAFNKMEHTYNPNPRIVRAWGNKGLVTIATE